MFASCESLTYAPDLLAPVLVEGCYSHMFRTSSSDKLNYIKCLATDISAENCTSSWVYRAAPSGTFVKKRGVEWPTQTPGLSTNGIPEGWTVIETDE